MVAVVDHPVWEPSSLVPLYVQVADWITARIESGDLVPGAKLPAERDLAEQVGLGYTTIHRAMRELRERGLIASRQGKGTFVLG